MVVGNRSSHRCGNSRYHVFRKSFWLRNEQKSYRTLYECPVECLKRHLPHNGWWSERLGNYGTPI